MEKIGRERRSESTWREIVARQAQSWLSVQAFCEKEIIKAASFYVWRSRLRRGFQDESSQPRAPWKTRLPKRSSVWLTGVRSFPLRGPAGFGRRCVAPPGPQLMFFPVGQMRVHLYGHPCAHPGD